VIIRSFIWWYVYVFVYSPFYAVKDNRLNCCASFARRFLRVVLGSGRRPRRLGSRYVGWPSLKPTVTIPFCFTLEFSSQLIQLTYITTDYDSKNLHLSFISRAWFPLIPLRNILAKGFLLEFFPYLVTGRGGAEFRRQNVIITRNQASVRQY
jgi:hypothetical protein